ncbi:MAG: hypothetical protein M3O71_21405 [Bacteroidota bacterium]|nr:hypothetical protein [Bacteroidota bacterium]
MKSRAGFIQLTIKTFCINFILVCFYCQALKAQQYSRGMGVYPANRKEFFGPGMNIYAIPYHPELISTSRQLAFNIKGLAYAAKQRTLSAVSRQVSDDDPYQLRTYLPDGFRAKKAGLDINS